MANPPELRSQRGLLEFTLHFEYQPTVLGEGPPRYCYRTDDGQESPTLRVKPGDEVVIHFRNDARAPGATLPAKPEQAGCQGGAMGPYATNLHFHGMSLPPLCHQDEVVHTLIEPGQSFEYRFRVPQDQAPGLYWYHPHPHGYNERQVLGGASGAIIVEGGEERSAEFKPRRERVLVLRDQSVAEPVGGPAWDISLNYVPVIYPRYQPAVLRTRPGERELWRVVNAGANTILHLQYVKNGVPQRLLLVALDGVALKPNSSLAESNTILLPPGARAEFVIATPAESESAQLLTTKWDTGPEGDLDPARPIARIVSSESAAAPVREAEPAAAQRHAEHDSEPAGKAIVQRTLYFSQVAPNADLGGVEGTEAVSVDVSVFYYLTAGGQKPKLYQTSDGPNIVVHQGDVEDWTVENRAQEDHVFHIHQIHFRVLERDGRPVNDSSLLDTIDLPYWSGSGPYPSVKLRMSFDDPKIVGTFLYHCHILKHEDMGMMGKIEVLPPGAATEMSLSGPAHTDVTSNVSFTAEVRGSGGRAMSDGTVQFFVDGLFAKQEPVKGGRASFSTLFGLPGQHTITALYSGTTEYDESAGQPLQITVAE